jgi:hypothetical protein
MGKPGTQLKRRNFGGDLEGRCNGRRQYTRSSFGIGIMAGFCFSL